MRETINTALKRAMKDKEALRLSTLRLMMAAIKDRDIALRADGNDEGADDGEITSILVKMVKQRKDSAQQYDDAGRDDLAKQEREEIKVIEDFLPKQLSADDAKAAVETAIAEVGAESIRDMGKVMGVLKAKYAGQMDFGQAGALVKELIGS